VLARFNAEEKIVVFRALEVIENNYVKPMTRKPIDSDGAKLIARLNLGGLDREAFLAIWLDAGKRVIDTEILFVGTLTQTPVYPREVVKAALRHNAQSVIVAHNHPSGLCDPSEADYRLTAELRSALALVGVDLVDHVIVGASEAKPLAEFEADALRDARARSRRRRITVELEACRQATERRREWREKCRCGRVLKAVAKKLRLSTGARLYKG
jgi:RadC-like JAB domain